jgi:hypothetical protein
VTLAFARWHENSTTGSNNSLWRGGVEGLFFHHNIAEASSQRLNRAIKIRKKKQGSIKGTGAGENYPQGIKQVLADANRN